MDESGFFKDFPGAEMPRYFYCGDGSASAPAGFQSLETPPAQQYLGATAGVYGLYDGLNRHRPLSIDFHSAHYQARGGKEYLPRAFRGCRDIADATAGWGRDAWLLAYRGFEVTLYERHPYLAFLLQEALRRVKNHPVGARLHWGGGEACAHLRNHEAIYLDPMYPARRKSAKVGLEMQALQWLHGDADDDGEALLNCALARGRRTVVKRPKGAAFLGGRPPAHSIEAPNTRYDVYRS